MNTEPLNVSYSQLGSFDRCHYSWYLSHHQGYVTTETKDYYQRGNFVDEFMQIWYRAQICGQSDGWDQILTRMTELHLEARTDEWGGAKTLDSLARAMNVVKVYIDQFIVNADRGWTFQSVQHELNVPFYTPRGRQFYLNGFADRLGYDENGRLWLIDDKTIGDGKFWTENQLLADIQMPTYVAGLRKQGFDVFGCIINQMNLYPYKNPNDYYPEKLFRRGEIFHSATEIDMHVIELGNCVDELIDTIDSGLYRKSRRRECDRCQYFEPCLLSMKNPEVAEDILNVNFTRRPTRWNGLEKIDINS